VQWVRLVHTNFSSCELVLKNWLGRIVSLDEWWWMNRSCSMLIVIIPNVHHQLERLELQMHHLETRLADDDAFIRKVGGINIMMPRIEYSTRSKRNFSWSDFHVPYSKPFFQTST